MESKRREYVLRGDELVELKQAPTLAARLRALAPRFPSRKVSATAGAVLSLGPFQAKWMSSDYQTYAREGFMGNPYVFASIRQVSMGLAGVPWLVYADASKKKLFSEHPYLSLLRRPNPTMGGGRFWETIAGFMLLDGNGYVEMVGPPNGPPDELWPLRPDRVRVVPGDAKNLVGGYTYAVGNESVTFPANRVLHYKFFHPMSDWYGFSPLTAAAKSVDQGNQAKAWNVALLQNGGQPTGAFTAPGVLDPDAYARIKEMIDERYAGFMNAGRPLMLEGGATWQEMGMSPKDMAWLEGQKLSAREIAMIFNIAPELIGDPDAKTFSNYQEARVALYQENILPYLDWLRDDLNAWLSPLYDGAVADYDKNGIEALSENRDAVYTRNNGAFAAGWMTIGMAQESAGMTVDKAVADYYKWQLPVSAPTDPTAPEPQVTVTPAAALPFPHLPATHPLNNPPQLPGAPDASAEPKDAGGKDAGGKDAGGKDDGAEPKDAPADTNKSITLTREAYDLVMRALETKSGGMARVSEAPAREVALLPFAASRRAMREVSDATD